MSLRAMGAEPRTSEDWRLVPLESLASLLVPVAITIALVAGRAAVREPSPVEVASAPLDLAVEITDRGYLVRGAWPALHAAELPTAIPCRRVPCGGSEDYDTDGLIEALAAVKRAHPGQRDIAVVPHPQIPYQTIVRTMEAARGGGELFPYTVVARR